MADIFEGVDTMKDNWEFDDEISEEEDIMDGNKGKTEESTDLNTTDDPKTSGISLFCVGGTRNKNQQKDRTNIITSSSIESKTEEEQKHGGDNIVMRNEKAVITDKNNNNNTIAPSATSVLNVLDNEISDGDDDDDDKSIIVNQDVQDKDEYTVLFQNTKLRMCPP